MFRIKICGITSAEDALFAAQCGADAVGLNFYDKSPRFIDFASANRIVTALPEGIIKVGVFVNAPSSQIIDSFDRLPLDLIQLHGDEPPDFVGQLGGRPCVRSFRVKRGGLESVRRFLEKCERINCRPAAILIDAFDPDHYGGTGQVGDWDELANKRSKLGSTQLVLAGGLSPANVAKAIRAVRPSAVDTASGVESSPGKKDRELVKAFVTAANAAFADLDSTRDALSET